MNKEELVWKVKNWIKGYPTLAEQIRGFYQLFLDESEDEVGNELHEAELCHESIVQLIEEHNNKEIKKT
jgi:hypothetical protein